MRHVMLLCGIALVPFTSSIECLKKGAVCAVTVAVTAYPLKLHAHGHSTN
jgi:hypothetical protein